jgi:glutathione synthase/RimK-type ligase-like ATP-grasp enzyme
VRLINPPSVLRWNQDKAYLVELAQAGAQVAPMRHFPVGSQVDLRQVLAEAGWEDYVLKPSISANAENSLAGRGAPDAASVALAERILGHCGLLVQPLFPEILAEGEWSLIFADEDLVHAVLKRPRAGDFRSQPDHGGTVLHQLPSREVMAQAQATLGIARALLGPLAYARVDGFVRDGRFYLIELELIEPYLFLQGAAAEAPRRLVDAILRALSVASP